MLSKYLTDEYLPTTEGQLNVQSLSVWYSASYILSISPSHLVYFIILFFNHIAFSFRATFSSTNTSIMGKGLISIVPSPHLSL